MKLFYISNSRIPTERAHGIQIMKMGEAFTKNGVEIDLLLPNRKNHISDDPFDYYKIKNQFKITKLSNIDLVGIIPKLGFWIQSISFAGAIKKYFKKNSEKLIIYSRDILPLFFLLKNKNLKLFYEIHNWPEQLNFIHKKVFNNVNFVAISHGLKNELLQYGVAENRILVSPDGVDIDTFVIDQSKEACRQKLNIGLDRKIVLYTGHLYKWKGVYEVLPAAQLLPEIDFYFIGGTKEDIEKFSEQVKKLDLPNIHLLGHKPYEQMPYYMKVADVLLLPNSQQFKISRLYTSPMKLFEYMTSSTPIVASDLPSIREILNQKNSILFKSDDPVSLAESIKRVLLDNVFNVKISQQALADVKKYTWINRAKNISKFIGLS